MTDGWVDVYPLDECTAFYRQELDTLYTAGDTETVVAYEKHCNRNFYALYCVFVFFLNCDTFLT